MKTIVIAMFLALVFVLGLAYAQTQQERGTCSVYGQVYGGDGRPLGGASVKILSASELVAHVETNDEGYYEIKDRASGMYVMSVDLKGFNHVERCVTLTHGRRLLVDFGLQVGIHGDFPMSQISGSVRVRNRSMLPGAIVKVVNPFGQELVAKTTTDSKGTYSLNLRVGGQYIVYAYKPGFAASSSAITLVERARVDLSLSPFKWQK